MTRHEKRVERIKGELANLGGPMLSGSLTQQWNVCGKPGCRCKSETDPVRHGPYYQLGFKIRGKSSTMFVKKEDVAEVETRISRYRQFRKLCMDLVEAYMDQAREEGLGTASKGGQA